MCVCGGVGWGGGIKVFARSICQGLRRVNQSQVHRGRCSAARKQQRRMRAGNAAGVALNISELPWDQFQRWQLLIRLCLPGRNPSGKWCRDTN